MGLQDISGVPIEISKMDERSIQLFQEALKDGDETVHSINIMVVGSIGTGKSTLIKRLIGGEVNVSEGHTIEAIGVHCCDVSLSTGAWKRQTKGFHWETNGKHACLSIWDIPGHRAFYASHQTVLTRRAIFLLVFDVTYYIDMPSKVHELVEVWLNSIHSCASSQEVVIPSVILVGTHVDELSQDKQQEICTRYFGEIRSYFKDKPTWFHVIGEDFVIDNTVVDSRMDDLRRKIVEVASQQPYWGEKLPARWLPIQQELMRQKANGLKVISHDDVMKINKKGAVQLEAEELDLFLSFLHETGVIIYGSIEKSKGQIVLDLTWTMNALNSLINARPEIPKFMKDNHTHSDSLPVGVSAQKCSDFHAKGILSTDLIDAMYPDLHENKDEMLSKMEENNIIAKPWKFTENGKIIEDYFLVPSMLHKKAPGEIISPAQNPMIVSTPVLYFEFTGKVLPPSIFGRLTAACISTGNWPVAKDKETSENLMFCDCIIFNLDLVHRLMLHCEEQVVFVRITRFVDDESQTPDEKLCTRARRIIMSSLSKLTSDLSQNLQYKVYSCWLPSQAFSEAGTVVPLQMWLADEKHDPDAPITPEHMNHARIFIALVTTCASAMRDVLCAFVPSKDINKCILNYKSKLTNKKTLQGFKVKCVFPDPESNSKTVGNVEQFDISLLYDLIKYISTVPIPPGTKWGEQPDDKKGDRDTSVKANVERINLYRNEICHPTKVTLKQEEFQNYWKRIEAVFVDLEQVLGKQNYKEQLEKQRKQVISVYEA